MKFRILILALSICGAAFISFYSCTDDPKASPVGIDEAAQKVLSEILNNDLDNLALYRNPVKMEAGIEIGHYTDPQPDELYKVTEPSWFFFIDDNPGMDWAHPCRYILVPYSGDKPRVIEEQWRPDIYDALEKYYNLDAAIQTFISTVLFDSLALKDLYYSSHILPKNTRITEPSDTGIVVEDFSWFLFIDDDPEAFYAHPCRYVLVTLWGGEISIFDEQWPPDMALELYVGP
ncbi:MAG: hypothetical protein AB1746_02965 [Candidatus Zixiibacteriota bacterium]